MKISSNNLTIFFTGLCSKEFEFKKDSNRLKRMFQDEEGEIFSKIAESSDIQGNLEVETKFGSFVTDDSGRERFESKIYWTQFERLQKFLREAAKEEIKEKTTDYIGKSSKDFLTKIRKRVYSADSPNGAERVEWQKKTTLRHFDIKKYNIRLSVNNELDIPEVSDFSVDTIREKIRFSYVLDSARIDMTIVDTITEKKREEKRVGIIMLGEEAPKITYTSYEVEVEMLGNLDKFREYEKQVVKIFQWLNETRMLYTVNEKNDLMKETNKILGTLGRKIVAEARNLKMRDMVWGGLIGGETLVKQTRQPGTAYTVTMKADGIRKLLIIDKIGIWLAYPPYEFNLVYRANFKGMTGTVLDGESIPFEKRKEGAPNTELWFLAFDCLAYQGVNVQDIVHSSSDNTIKSRALYVDTISKTFKTPILTIESKSFREFRTVEKFYNVMTVMFNNLDKMAYETDGFMFTPINPPYNSRLENVPLHTRKLSKYQDICKWKPKEKITIDFRIKWIQLEGGKRAIDLYVGELDGRKMKDVKFVGSKYNPFNGEIDTEHPVTIEIPTGTVVEYGWNYEKGVLFPHRVRHDKIHPNRKEVALDDWDDIHNPITKELMEGSSFELVYRYHNKIKRELFNQAKNGSVLLDVGSGRGGDVSKWEKFTKIFAIEPNEEHVTELMRRIQVEDKEVTIIQSKAEEALQFIKEKVDVISLMLSMTFFWESSDTLDILIKLITETLKPGGMVFFIAMDGDVVEQLFSPVMGGATFKTIQLGPAIMDFDPDQKRISGKGKRVHINIVDTIVTDQDEYLVHLDDFLERLSPYGFSVKYVNRADKERFLGENQKLYSSLFSYGILVRDRPDQTLTKNVIGRVAKVSAPKLKISTTVAPSPAKGVFIAPSPTKTPPVIVAPTQSPAKAPFITPSPAKAPPVIVAPSPVKAPPVIVAPTPSPSKRPTRTVPKIAIGKPPVTTAAPAISVPTAARISVPIFVPTVSTEPLRPIAKPVAKLRPVVKR